LLGDFHQGYDLPPSGSIAAMTLWRNCRHGLRRRHSCRGGISAGEFLPDGNSSNTMGIVTRPVQLPLSLLYFLFTSVNIC
jgi:hypothetical protein